MTMERFYRGYQVGKQMRAERERKRSEEALGGLLSPEELALYKADPSGRLLKLWQTGQEQRQKQERIGGLTERGRQALKLKELGVPDWMIKERMGRPPEEIETERQAKMMGVTRRWGMGAEPKRVMDILKPYPEPVQKGMYGEYAETGKVPTKVPEIYDPYLSEEEGAKKEIPQWRAMIEFENRRAKGEKLSPGQTMSLNKYKGEQLTLGKLLSSYNIVGNYMMGGNPNSPQALAIKRQIQTIVKKHLRKETQDNTVNALLDFMGQSEEEKKTSISDMKANKAEYEGIGVDVDYILENLGE